ncbi:MAG: UvrB/UvrC motif-containing protein, partial [Oscillospiraceae bacterium]|nr:UvrB/UvrC motif-containing protein [Oscillospiraceae bacterium]
WDSGDAGDAGDVGAGIGDNLDGGVNYNAPYFGGNAAGAPDPDAGKRLEKLKVLLIEAINEEEYEVAAELRDQIKAIENTM